MSEYGDLGDVAVVAHLLQNRLAAVTGAVAMLRSAAALTDDDRAVLLDVVERSSASIEPAIALLQRGLPAAALAELSGGSAPLPHRSSGVESSFPVPDDEAERLAALERYDILDQPLEPELERIARLAAAVAGAPSAFVNLIDEARQWAAAAAGGERVEVPRCDAMCNLTLAVKQPVVVRDASDDNRFSASPWVTGVLGDVRFYASIPLLTSDGHAVGTLCVVDSEPHALEASTVEVLSDLAALAIGVLEARIAGQELRRLLAPLAGEGSSGRFGAGGPEPPARAMARHPVPPYRVGSTEGRGHGCDDRWAAWRWRSGRRWSRWQACRGRRRRRSSR